jgi:hypothetical protein
MELSFYLMLFPTFPEFAHALRRKNIRFGIKITINGIGRILPGV